MKKVLILALILLTTSLSFAQDYNRWAIGADFGVHAVGDQSALVTDAFNHYGLNVRYSLNPIVSVGLSGGFDNLSLEDLEGYNSETNYGRVSAEAFIDVLDILKLQNNVFTMLFHGGPGWSHISNSGRYTPSLLPADPEKFYGYTDNVFSLTGGVTGLFKISKSFAATLAYRNTANITQDRTLDGYMPIGNAEVNSTVSNFKVGLTWYPGKRKGKKEHADWYVAPTPVYTIVEQITQVTEAPITNITQVVGDCNCSVYENVYFENDKDEVKIQGLNAIEQIANYLFQNKDAKVVITGSASPTASTSLEYDLDLSKRRVSKVEDKLTSLGVSDSRIIVQYIGKDTDRQTVHEFARRVELRIE